jgi:hypothetical protein
MIEVSPERLFCDRFRAFIQPGIARTIEACATATELPFVNADSQSADDEALCAFFCIRVKDF